MSFHVKFWEYHSIPWPQFLYSVWNFGGWRFQSILTIDKLKVRHIFTSGLLTYCPTKYATRFSTPQLTMITSTKFEVDYDHPQLNYSVLVIAILRARATLTVDLLTFDSGHAWWVTCLIPLPSLEILRLSILELWLMTSLIDNAFAATVHGPDHVTCS